MISKKIPQEYDENLRSSHTIPSAQHSPGKTIDRHRGGSLVLANLQRTAEQSSLEDGSSKILEFWLLLLIFNGPLHRVQYLQTKVYLQENNKQHRYRLYYI
jgi:hypothetical protein